MKYMLMMVMALALLLPCSAGQREDALLGDLLGFGTRVLEAQTANPAARHAAPPSQVAPAPQAAARGNGRAPQPMSGGMLAPIMQVVDELLEQYKEEGRAYANELGGIVVKRVVQDPEINSTITSLQVLSWAVIAYLTLVTIVMLVCLAYLKRSNAKLLAEVQALARRAQD